MHYFIRKQIEQKQRMVPGMNPFVFYFSPTTGKLENIRTKVFESARISTDADKLVHMIKGTGINPAQSEIYYEIPERF